MIPGFTMRVRVTNRKALLAWFAGQPGETGITWERPSGSGTPRGQPFLRCQRGPWRKWRFDAPRSRQGFTVQHAPYGLGAAPDDRATKNRP